MPSLPLCLRVVLTLLVGCCLLLACDDETAPGVAPDAMLDARSDASLDAALDASPDAAFVVVTLIDTWHDPAGGLPIEVAVDPLTRHVRFALQIGDSVIEPASITPGEVRFAVAAPEGPYQLVTEDAPPDLPGVARGVVSVTEVSGGVIRRGLPFAGRPDVTPITSPTPITLRLTGDRPFGVVREDLETGELVGVADRLELFAPAVDGYAAFALDETSGQVSGLPAIDATALDGLGFDWASVGFSYARGAPVEVAATESLQLTHLAATVVTGGGDDWEGASLYSPVQSVSLAGPIVDGVAKTLEGVFAPLPQAAFELEYPGDRWSAVLAAAMPATPDASTASVRISREPGQAGGLLIGYGPTLVEVQASGYATDDGWRDPGALAARAFVGDPYAPAGRASLSVSLDRSVWVDDPGGGAREALVGSISARRPAEALDGATIEPIVGPPLAVTVAGVALAPGATAAGVGSTPTIAWAAPSLGEPDRYLVQLRTVTDVVDEAGVLRSRRRVVAVFEQTGTSLTVPAGLLQAGHWYTARVAASVASTLGADGSYAEVQGRGLVSTGLFSP